MNARHFDFTIAKEQHDGKNETTAPKTQYSLAQKQKPLPPPEKPSPLTRLIIAAFLKYGKQKRDGNVVVSEEVAARPKAWPER
ncbi:hypothetical protein ANRL4_04496 [Anaerolineae bacterium]|nr:hypothetical protein ANRL4_04496 [Anaerolineae bacterium]